MKETLITLGELTNINVSTQLTLFNWKEFQSLLVTIAPTIIEACTSFDPPLARPSS